MSGYATRSSVESVVKDVAESLGKKIDAAETRIGIKISAVETAVAASAAIAEENHLELNRKLNEILAKLGLGLGK